MEESIKCTYFVEGMHCAACELLIEDKLKDIKGVKKVEAKLAEGKVYLESNRSLTSDELSKLVEEDGYRIVEGKEKSKTNYKTLGFGFLLAIAFFGGFLLLQKLGILNLANTNGQITYPFIFLIGIIASLSTCMAVVGGLVLSLSSNYAKGEQTKPMILFHASRIIGFFILGGVIGLLGSAFILTPTMSFILNLVLFAVMLIMSINLLDVLPFARRLQLKMPKAIGKNVLKIKETNSSLTPILLGAVTFFLPCGFTQSMQLYSLTTGNFLSGALTMLIFALGTFPILALISFASTKLSKGLQSELFFKTAGFIIIFFAIFNFTAALAAIGIINPVFNI